MATLVPVCGTRQSVPLTGDEFVLGRGERCELLVDDARASKRHAVLRPTSGGWTVSDLGSTNGTYVNGKRLKGERSLNLEDRIQIGRTFFVFQPTVEAKPVHASDRSEAGERDADCTQDVPAAIFLGEADVTPKKTTDRPESIGEPDTARRPYLAAIAGATPRDAVRPVPSRLVPRALLVHDVLGALDQIERAVWSGNGAQAVQMIRWLRLEIGRGAGVTVTGAA